VSKAKLKEKSSNPLPVPALPPGPVSGADYKTAFAKAEKGDTAAMAIVRRAFEEDPDRWRVLGNIAHWARRTVAATAVTGEDLPRLEDERRHRAHRRLVHAVCELAQVRRLLRPGPAVQVNASVAQVNVGTPSPAARINAEETADPCGGSLSLRPDSDPRLRPKKKASQVASVGRTIRAPVQEGIP
jgi:hypothetical protein